MSTPDDNLPPQTSKFFDIIPSNKRSSASPNSRPLITPKSVPQSDSMINKEDQPGAIEITSEQLPKPEPVVDEVSETTEDTVNQSGAESLATADTEPEQDEDTPPPVQTDIDQADSEEPQVEIAATDNEPSKDEDTPPPVQTDIEEASTTDSEHAKPEEEELLLPAKATPDEPTTPDAVVIHSPENSRSFRLRTWLIALLFVIIIAIIALVLYAFVFKANSTITPNTQIFGS